MKFRETFRPENEVSEQSVEIKIAFDYGARAYEHSCCNVFLVQY